LGVADIVTDDPEHIVIDFDRSDLESQLYSESNFYRKSTV